MKLYERYVDNSNQVAVAPPKGAKYNRERKKVEVEEECNDETQDDERLANILKEIANGVMSCIQMEANWPNRNTDGKLPILHLKVWTGRDNKIMYTHYEKPMATRNVLHSKSAHPETCKRSIHTQEVLRRLLNCSKELNLKEDIAPIVSEYMYRMKLAEYKEGYRKSILKGAMKIYKEKIEADRQGVRPMFRHKEWKRDERDKERVDKRKKRARKRGHTAPIYFPATPGGELAKVMKKLRIRKPVKKIL